MNPIYVYDIETYSNIFTFIFRLVKAGKPEYHVFEISSRKNQIRELVLFLKNPQTQVGYNNCAFDYPIIHFIINNPNCTLEELYHEKNQIFNSVFNRVPSWEFIIPQADLYKIWHYDNAARSTSLKWLEFTLRWHKVQDLPFDPTKPVPIELFDKLIEYNKNDVDFTYKFLGMSMDQLNFRSQMSDYLDHNVINYSDVKIGEYINRITYEKKSGKKYWEFKTQRTHRDIFNVAELIPEWVSYKTPEFNSFLSKIRPLSFTLEKDDKFEHNPSLGGIVLNFMKGGLHSQDYSRVVECKEGYYLKEADVGSMYPKSIIEGNLYPEHLGPSWRMGIKDMYEERVNEMKPALKKMDKNLPEYSFLNSKQGAYKLAMNGGGYGKTGSEYSWQYDPMVTMKTTFRGQLALMMLVEEFYLIGVEIISANTDGVVIHYAKELHDEVMSIQKDWESKTCYELEDTHYSRIVFRNVNHYLAEIIDKETSKRYKVKYKGVFEFDPEPHKNNSQRIVPIALMEYFVNGIPIRDVIENVGYEFTNTKDNLEKTSIYDYCHGRKKSHGVKNYTLVTTKGNIVYTDKVIRYYISKSGETMYKLYNSGKKEAVNKGFCHTVFMDYEEKENYNIDFNYYIRECEKIIDTIEKGFDPNNIDVEQLTLF